MRAQAAAAPRWALAVAHVGAMRGCLSTTTLVHRYRDLCTRARVEQPVRAAGMTTEQGCMQKKQSRSLFMKLAMINLLQIHSASR